MSEKIWIALIGAAASIITAAFTGGFFGKWEAAAQIEKIGIFSAGRINADKTVDFSLGKIPSIDKNKSATGKYHLKFEGLTGRHAALVVTQPCKRGEIARVAAGDEKGFTVETRSYGDNDLSDCAFTYLVLQPGKEK